MEGKSIATIIGIVILVVVGFLIFNGGDGDLADNNGLNATTTEENLTGTGGPDGDFDPLDGIDGDNMDGSGEVEGAFYPSKG